MRRLLPLLLLVGCGPVDFTGRYKGTLDRAALCNDGSTAMTTDLSSWKLTDNNGTISIFSSGGSACTTLSAKSKGDHAELSAKQCPAYGDSTISVVETVKSGGTLRLQADKLVVKMTVAASLYYPMTNRFYSCEATVTGQLTLQPE